MRLDYSMPGSGLGGGSAGRRTLESESKSRKNLANAKYKTELCKSFRETGNCKYGEKCQFAHGAAELRSVPRHPKYKTEKCKSFHTTGFCPYGPRCDFIHVSDDEHHFAPASTPNPIDISNHPIILSLAQQQRQLCVQVRHHSLSKSCFRDSSGGQVHLFTLSKSP